MDGSRIARRGWTVTPPAPFTAVAYRLTGQFLGPFGVTLIDADGGEHPTLLWGSTRKEARAEVASTPAYRLLPETD